MTKFFTVFLIVFTVFLSSCGLFEKKGIDYLKVSSGLDALKFAQFRLVNEFDGSLELALMEKSDDAIFGVMLGELFTSYNAYVSNINHIFEEMWDYQKEEMIFKDFYFDYYNPALISYNEFLQDFYDKLTTLVLTEEEFNSEVKILNEKSEEFFYVHVELTNLFFSNVWNMSFFMVD